MPLSLREFRAFGNGVLSLVYQTHAGSTAKDAIAS
jgi:hypothetical protein